MEHHVRYASSAHIIVSDMMMGLMTVVISSSAQFGGGTLGRFFARAGESSEWAQILLPSGLAMIIGAVMKAVCRGRSHDSTILHITQLRCVGAFFSIYCWLYLSVSMWMTPEGRHVVSIACWAPFEFAYCVYSFIVNMSVKYALDPKKETPWLMYGRRALE